MRDLLDERDAAALDGACSIRRAPTTPPRLLCRTAGYRVLLTRDDTLVRAAQCLRHRVFVTEPGFAVTPSSDGLDRDRFDAHCDHIVVVAESSAPSLTATDSVVTDTSVGGQVVGTYRILPGDRLPRPTGPGQWYSASEFELVGIPSSGAVAEMGRAVVAREHRSGIVVTLLWSGIMAYLSTTPVTTLFGCVSIPMNGPGGTVRGADVAAIRETITRTGAWYEEWFARPRIPVRVPAMGHAGDRPASVILDDETGARLLAAPRARGETLKVPPLVQGYLRMGAKAMGEPSFDPDFDVADLPVVLDVADANLRYLDRLARLAGISKGPQSSGTVQGSEEPRTASTARVAELSLPSGRSVKGS